MASCDEQSSSSTSSPHKELTEKQIEEIEAYIKEIKYSFCSHRHAIDHALIRSLSKKSSTLAEIEYYLSHGASALATDSDRKMTTLDLAVVKGDKDIVKLILYHGVTPSEDLDMKHYKGLIEDGRLDILKQLFSAGDKERLLEELDTSFIDVKYSPLYWALHFSKYDIFKYLVEQGMDIDQYIDYPRGYNALHHAAKSGNAKLVDSLLELGASVYKPTFKWEYMLPLQIAVNYGHKDLAVNKLLPKDINAPDPKDIEWLVSDDGGLTMLQYACYADRATSAKILVERGADPSKSVKGRLPLQVAIMNGAQKIIDYLYPLTDLSLMEWDKRDLSEAFYNCANSQQEHENGRLVNVTVAGKPLLSFLLEAGAVVNEVDSSFSDTPLIAACRMKNSEHMKILLDYGADPNLQWHSYQTNDNKGMVNPLFCTVNDKGNKVECLKVLLRANPDVPRLSSIKVPRKFGEGMRVKYKSFTPAQLALLTRNGKLITLCVEAGCCLYDTKDALGVVKDKVKPPLQPHIIDAIQTYDDCPRSLKYHAKFAVRRCLGHKDVDARIDSLPVPNTMKDFLKYIGF